MRVLPPILKDQPGMAADYSCRLGRGSIARIKLERRARTQFWIDWVFVPPGFRDGGHGRRMMNQVIADADAHRVRLSLEARACAGLDQETLEAWYASFGFVKSPFRGDFGPILVRQPAARSARLAA
jgi:GNAT superfamily N-acetyltransferase